MEYLWSQAEPKCALYSKGKGEATGLLQDHCRTPPVQPFTTHLLVSLLHHLLYLILLLPSVCSPIHGFDMLKKLN